MPDSTISELLAEGYRPRYDEVIKDHIYIPPAVPIEIIPHDKAPLFSDQKLGRERLLNLARQMMSEEFCLTDEILELIRQASYVSLYFFLKYIAGAYGPYADLTDHIHVEVCNFRQRMLGAGARGAVFLPRSFYKSTICTHGAIAWELLRDPNLRVGLCAANIEMAEQFMEPTKMVFEDNPLFEALFPEYCPAKSESGKVTNKGWSSSKITLPNRTRKMPEPSVKCLGAGGSSAGNHFDLLSVDDLVSEKELDSSRGATSEMIKKGQWFSSNQDTLLISPRTSRVFLAATRYAINDPYEDIFTEVKKMHGYWDELPYELNKETGVWEVYYRMAIERGRYVFPEKVGKIELDRIKDKDLWKYFTQYLNNPHSACVTEFSEYGIKKCQIDHTYAEGFKIHHFAGEIALSSCHVTIGIDPAASETKKRATTSRTAIVVRARDHNDNRYYIDGSVGYMAPTKIYDEIFRLYQKYRGYVANTHIEAHGGFKIIYNSLIEEEKKRGIWVGKRRISPLPDKDAKLRDFLQPLLHEGRIYAADPIHQYINDEITVFPGGHMRDTLDAMEIADRGTSTPKDQAAIKRAELESQRRRRGVKSRAGY